MLETNRWKEILLSDREAVEEIRRRSGNQCAAQIFPNLFLWREEYGLSLFMEKELFAIKYGAQGANHYFAPCGSDKAKQAFVQRLLDKSSTGVCFHYLFQQDCVFFKEYFPDRFVITEAPGDSEYILNVGEHSRMEGAQFAKIRSEVKKEREKGELTAKPLEKKLLCDAHAVLGDWVSFRTAQGINMASRKPAEQALEHFSALGLSGAVFYRENIPVGFNIGAPIAEGVLDGIINICMGFSTMEFYMNAVYCQMLSDRYQYLNIEEDLGIQGLRTRKLKTKPCRIEKAWRCESR